MGLPRYSSDLLYYALKEHIGHDIVCISYAGGENIAIECETCSTVLIDCDAPAAYWETQSDGPARH